MRVNWIASGVKIGRHSNVDVAVAGVDPDRIAYEVHALIKRQKLLASHHYGVTVVMFTDGRTADVKVEAGCRIVSTFTLACVPLPPPSGPDSDHD